MPLNYLKKNLLIIILCLLLSACSTPKALEYREFKNLRIEKLGFATSSVRMDMYYYNPNHFGLQLKRADLDIYLDNNLAGHATQEYQITIPKLAEFAIPVQIDVDMKNILRNAFATILSNQMLVKITGTIKVGKANIFITFPVYYEGNQTYKLN